jgi:hypothetical protein
MKFEAAAEKGTTFCRRNLKMIVIMIMISELPSQASVAR